MLFIDDAIQNVNSKEGIILGRQQIKETESYSDGVELNANILGYQYLENNIAIAYGKWTSKTERQFNCQRSMGKPFQDRRRKGSID